MFLKFFKSSQPVIIFVIPILAILLWLPNFLEPDKFVLQEELTMPFSQWLTEFLRNNVIVYHILAVIFNTTNAFLINRINNQHILISDRTYLPAFIYLFLSAFIVHSPYNLYLFISIFILLIVINRVFYVSTDKNLLNVFFESGFLIGIGALFIFNFWVFTFMVFISIMYLRPFYWREYVMVIIGFLTPFFFAVVYYFLIGNLGAVHHFFEKNFVVLPKFALTLKGVIFYSVIAFIFLTSVISLNMHLIKKKIITRKYYKIFLWLTLLPLVAFFILPNITRDLFIFSSVPLAFIFANFYVSIKNRWIQEFMFIIFLLGIVALYVPL